MRKRRLEGLDLLKLYCWPDGIVPPVEPSDVRKCWTIIQGHKATNPPASIGISLEAIPDVKHPDAAIYRARILQVLSARLELLTAWLCSETQLADAVFAVAATFPMKTEVGVFWPEQRGFPVDIEEFMHLVERRLKEKN